MTSFLAICAVAFATVFVVLAALAFIMRVIVAAVPHKKIDDSGDPALYAAIAASLKSAYPNMAITKIEEKK